MVTKLRRDEFLVQVVVAWEIEELFGESYIYINANGNPAINAKILKEFEKLTGEAVVWENRERLWRYRQEYDMVGRKQP